MGSPVGSAETKTESSPSGARQRCWIDHSGRDDRQWTRLRPPGPDLLESIKSRMDQLLHLDPWAVVALLGLIMLLIPVSVVTLYLVQRRRLGFDPRR